MPAVIRIVTAAKITLESSGFAKLFPMLPMATGISVRPIVVMTLPVTSGGKNLRIFEKKPEIKMTIKPETMIEPKMAPERKAAPALVTGNTIVIKPSQLTPEMLMCLLRL